MSLHGPARHLELAGDFGIVTALQKQFDDLLFARSKPNGLLVHYSPYGLDSPGLKTQYTAGCFQIT
jgi:hypothetical protein